MRQTTRTIDLAAVAAPSSYIGQRAVWTDFDGREHVGVLAADPFGGCWPVVDLGDGSSQVYAVADLLAALGGAR